MKTEQSSTPTTQRGHFETVYTNTKTVSCEGNNPALGHPRVFLKLKEGKVVCPYCSKTFIFQEQSDNH